MPSRIKHPMAVSTTGFFGVKGLWGEKLFFMEEGV
jgi:hypothetical protein